LSVRKRGKTRLRIPTMVNTIGVFMAATVRVQVDFKSKGNFKENSVAFPCRSARLLRFRNGRGHRMQRTESHRYSTESRGERVFSVVCFAFSKNLSTGAVSK